MGERVLRKTTMSLSHSTMWMKAVKAESILNPGSKWVTVVAEEIRELLGEFGVIQTMSQWSRIRNCVVWIKRSSIVKNLIAEKQRLLGKKISLIVSVSSLRQEPQQDYISKLISMGLSICFRHDCPLLLSWMWGPAWTHYISWSSDLLRCTPPYKLPS